MMMVLLRITTVVRRAETLFLIFHYFICTFTEPEQKVYLGQDSHPD